MWQGKPHKSLRIDDIDILHPIPPLIKTVEEPTVPQMVHDEPKQVAQPMESTGL
jgi:hypothetical protein